jgi:hypothetical protein
MGVTEAAKIKIWNHLSSSAKSAFFQIADSSSLWGPLDDLSSINVKAMTSIFFLIDFEGVSFKPWVPNFEIGEPYFLAEFFFPESGLIFSLFKIPPR